MNSRFWLCVALGLSLASGCSRQQSPNAASPQKESAKAERSRTSLGREKNQKPADDAVLIRCGTNEFTMGEAKKIADLRVRMMQMSLPKGQNIKPNDAILARVLAAVPYGFPRDCAVADFAATNGIAVGKEVMELMRSRAKQGAKQGFLSWPAFSRKLGKEDRATLDGRIQTEALMESVRRWHAENRPATVTKEELQTGVMIRKGKKVYHKALIG